MRSLLEATPAPPERPELEAPPSPLTQSLDRPATPASLASGSRDDMGLVNDLVSTSLSSMERRAQLLEEELARSRREAEARERELREAKEKRDDERREVDAALARERARHAEELDALRATAQRDLEQSLRSVHALSLIHI